MVGISSGPPKNSSLRSPCLHFLFVHEQKKPAQIYSVAGFTIRSLIPMVTTLGCQFIASTTASNEFPFTPTFSWKGLDRQSTGGATTTRMRLIDDKILVGER
jgi:hypothetical protein